MRLQHGVLPDDHHLTQRRALEVVLTFERPDQLFKGQVLMGIGCQRGRTDPLQHLPTRRVAAKVRPENHRIDQRGQSVPPSPVASDWRQGWPHARLLGPYSHTGAF